MVREAIVLAGGLGTRLREVVPDLPISLAKFYNFHKDNKSVLSLALKPVGDCSRYGMC